LGEKMPLIMIIIIRMEDPTECPLISSGV